MNRTKRYMYNSVAAFTAEIVTMILGFVTPRIILVTYGSELNGLTSSILQFMSYFNLVEAGFSNAAVYALYKPFADKDEKAISAVVSAARRMYLRAGGIFCALVVGLALIYPLYIDVDGLSNLDVGLLVLILGVSNVLNFFTLSKHRAVITADMRVYVISLSNIAFSLANTLIIVFLAQNGVGLVELRFWALAAAFLRAGILSLYCHKRYAFIDEKAEPNFAALNKSKDALFHEVLYALYKGAPIALITLILRDMAVVSVYNVYSMVIMGIAGLLAVFSSGLAPSFGNVIMLGEMDTLGQAYGEFEFTYYSIITAVYTVAMVMIMPFVRIYTRGVTDAVYDLPVVGLLFCVNSLAHNFRMPQMMLVSAGGHYRETRSHSVIQLTISVGLGALLIQPLGIAGILIGSLCSNLYRATALIRFVPTQYSQLRSRRSFLRILRVAVTVLLGVLPFCWIPVAPDGYLSWALCALGVCAYAALLAILSGVLFERKELKNVLRRIRRLRRA